MTGILDFGMGNLGSVKRKLDLIGGKSIVSGFPSDLEKCDHFILPGVGHFQQATNELQKRGLWDFLNNEILVKKKPILGICLGMQLMAAHSEEGDVNGFAWLDADVVRFRIRNHIKYKVPHIGWNHVEIKKNSRLFQNVEMDTGFYFVHSYHLECSNSIDILNVTEYEYQFVSAVEKDNIMGVQFHPEKSHGPGEQLLRNFLTT